MSYILVDKNQLDEKGLFPFAELLPDGRAILPLNVLKTVTGLIGIDIVDSETVKLLQAEAPSTEITPVEPTDPPAENTESENTTENQIEKEVVNG